MGELNYIKIKTFVPPESLLKERQILCGITLMMNLKRKVKIVKKRVEKYLPSAWGQKVRTGWQKDTNSHLKDE